MKFTRETQIFDKTITDFSDTLPITDYYCIPQSMSAFPYHEFRNRLRDFAYYKIQYIDNKKNTDGSYPMTKEEKDKKINGVVDSFSNFYQNLLQESEYLKKYTFEHLSQKTRRDLIALLKERSVFGRDVLLREAPLLLLVQIRENSPNSDDVESEITKRIREMGINTFFCDFAEKLPLSTLFAFAEMYAMTPEMWETIIEKNLLEEMFEYMFSREYPEYFLIDYLLPFPEKVSLIPDNVFDDLKNDEEKEKYTKVVSYMKENTEKFRDAFQVQVKYNEPFDEERHSKICEQRQTLTREAIAFVKNLNGEKS